MKFLKIPSVRSDKSFLQLKDNHLLFNKQKTV